MTILKRRLLSAFGILLLAGAAKGQEFFREFGAPETAPGFNRLTPGIEVFSGNDPGMSDLPGIDEYDEEDNYNMRLGNFDFIAAIGLGVEFNDNITLASKDEISDIIFRPQLDLEGVIRFSETSRLRLGVGIGYAKYLDHDEYDTDGLLISPLSSIQWTVETGAFTFTLRENISYQEDPFDLVTLDNTALYRRWENQAGLQVDWDANQYTKITAGYDRYDLWTKDEEYKSYEHSTDTIYLRPSFQVSPTVTVGLNASYSWVDYRENIQADARVLLVGPFVQWKVSDYVDVYAEGGYQLSDFDGGTLRGIGSTGIPNVDEDDSSSYYFRLWITHRPTENFRHRLGGSRSTELNYGSNFYELYRVEYDADWKFAENTAFRTSVFYEWYETSGEAAEEAYRFGAAAGIYHIFSEHLTLGLDYRFLMKDSNLPDSDYTQNIGLISLYYKF